MAPLGRFLGRPLQRPVSIGIRRQLLTQDCAYRGVFLDGPHAGSFEDIGVHGNRQLHGERLHEVRVTTGLVPHGNPDRESNVRRPGRTPAGVGFPGVSIAITPYGISLSSLAKRTTMKEATTKVTVHLPTALLQQARAITGEGVTGTVRQGLRQIAAVHAQRKLRGLRGKVPITLDIEKLREDRDLDRM